MYIIYICMYYYMYRYHFYRYEYRCTYICLHFICMNMCAYEKKRIQRAFKMQFLSFICKQSVF